MTESPTAGTTEADADVPRHRYTADLAGQIERTWQDNWQAWGTFNVPNPVGSLAPADGSAVPADKVFVQDMFPYPSGEGLHVGHPLGYIATDVYGRFKRMDGYNVLRGIDRYIPPTQAFGCCQWRLILRDPTQDAQCRTAFWGLRKETRGALSHMSKQI